MQFNIAIRVIVGREQDFHHKKNSLWSCKHQTMENIIPEEGFKRLEGAGIDSFS